MLKEILQLNPTTFKTIFDKDSEIEIGDIESSDFKPQVKLKRWGDECFCKVNYPTHKKITPIQENGKLKWKDTDKEIHFYLLEKTEEQAEGFEFEIILKKKLKSNIIQTLNIETQGLKYYYQPPLTEEYQNGYSEEFKKEIVVSETDVKDLEGNVLVRRPENVVGSYAVYHESKKGNYEALGGKNYKAGKAFHIYRPKIFDNAGKEVWGILNITSDKLTVETPQEFLDNAVYPVKVDPTFGCDPASPGASNQSFLNNIRSLKATSTEAGTATSISAYIDSYTAGNSTKAALYLQSDESLLSPQTEEKEVDATGWLDWNFTNGPSISATDYLIAIWTGTQITRVRYDSVSVAGRYKSLTYNGWPNPYGSSSSNYQISVYCTYTASGISPNVSDQLNITEDITAENTQLSRDVSDQINITETASVDVLPPALAVSVSDDISISESITSENTQLGGINVFSSLTITEQTTIENILKGISISDDLTLTEDTTIQVGAVSTLNVSVFDSVSITEDITPEITSFISISDQLNITEDTTVQVSAISELNVNVFDSITITESVVLESSSFINVNDNISLTEGISLANTQLGGVNVSDTITITESATVEALGAGLAISVSDNISLSESVSSTNTQLGSVSVFDSLTITESSSVNVSGVILSISLNQDIIGVHIFQ